MLSLQDCIHFDFGDGTCPFGTSCFYRHAYRDGRLEVRPSALLHTRHVLLSDAAYLAVSEGSSLARKLWKGTVVVFKRAEFLKQLFLSRTDAWRDSRDSYGVNQ